MKKSIHIVAEDWMITAGLIGLTRLFDEDEDMITSLGIELCEEHLNDIAERYFNYLLKEFSIVDRDVDRLNWYSQQAKNKPENIKSYISEFRKIVNEQIKKVKKYYPDTEEYGQLQIIADELKTIKKKEHISKIDEIIKDYKKIMSKQFINEKLTLNYVKAVILAPLFGQPSFLQPTFNAKNKQEHIEQFNKDFIYPAQLEFKFNEYIRTIKSHEEITKFLYENKVYKPFNDLYKTFKRFKSNEQMNEFIQAEMLPCSFIDGLVATQSYEEKVFSPLALSKDKAVNFSWNFNKATPVPISAIARLIIFLSPIGLATYTRKIGTIRSSEILRFSGLILSQQPFPENVKYNNTYYTMRKKGTTFEETIIGLLQETVDKAKKQINSYLIVEFYSDYNTKKTLLDYYHMPPYLANYLSRYGDSLYLLKHKDLREQFLRTLLKGLDPKKNLFEYLREAVVNPFHSQGAYIATRERCRFLEAKKGGKNMSTHDKIVSFIYYRGVDLQKKILMDREENYEGGPYKASGRKKIESIAYRLINAAKAGNKKSFMDTIFRIHLAAGLEIPSIFMDIYKENGLDFETISSAFIAGLLGENIRGKEEGNE